MNNIKTIYKLNWKALYWLYFCFEYNRKLHNVVLIKLEARDRMKAGLSLIQTVQGTNLGKFFPDQSSEIILLLSKQYL